MFSIDPVGILKACTTHVRIKSARMTAITIDSKYSRIVDFLNDCGWLNLLISHFKYSQKSLLRYLHVTNTLHTTFTFILLFELFPLPTNVAAITYRKHVLSKRFHALTGDNPRSNGSLNSHLKHLSRDQLAHFPSQSSSASVGHLLVNNNGQGINWIAINYKI